MMDNTLGNNSKFADDGTIWHTGPDLKELKLKISQDISEVLDWTRNWRINVSVEKSEFCFFSTRNIPDSENTLQVNNNNFTYNSSTKILGVILDEHMTFSNHIDHVERISNAALHTIREIKGISKMSRTKLLQIYNSLVRSVIEYSSPVWQVVSSDKMRSLEAVQRKGLALCLGLPATAGREALEVEANIIPIDLRIKEIALREIAKIQSKSIEEPVKQQLEKYNAAENMYERLTSPFGKAINQAVDMYKSTNVDIKLMEPEYTYHAGCQLLMKKTPQYWSRLGSSKSRTEEQVALSKEIVSQIVGDSLDSSIIAFTDGSCQGNPGPCGAGAVIFQDNERPVNLKRHVAHRGSILLPELVAILLIQHIRYTG